MTAQISFNKAKTTANTTVDCHKNHQAVSEIVEKLAVTIPRNVTIQQRQTSIWSHCGFIPEGIQKWCKDT